MDDTSLSLLERARNKSDEDSWLRLVEIYSPLLRACLRKWRFSPQDADDLVQEVLLAISRELPRFEHSGRTGAFRSWVRTILFHRMRNQLRANAHRPQPLGGTSWVDQVEQLADEVSDVSREWNLDHDRFVLAGLLRQVQARVDGKTWEAFHRQVYNSEKPGAVALELEMPLSSVYVARSRVLRMLRQAAAGLVETG